MSSPIQDAYPRYRQLRRQGGPRAMPAADRGWYYTYRSYRVYTKYWLKSRKAALVEQAGDSLVVAGGVLREWQEFETWMNSLSIPEEKNARILRGLQNRVSEKVDELEERVELYTDDDPVLTNIKEAIAEAANDLGLLPSERYAEVDDGCAWFEDEDGKHYFVALANLNGRYNPFNVLATPMARRHPGKWARYSHTDLFRLGLQLMHPKPRHPAWLLNDNFGVWNRLSVPEGDVPAGVEKVLSRLPLIQRNR